MNNLPVVRSPWRIAILTVGFTFLYAPMLMLVIYSFNSSKLVTVWAGWSTRWYTELFHDSAMISAVGLSLTIAAAAATAAVVLGAIAAVRGDGARLRLAVGARHVHYLAGACHLLYRLCGGGDQFAPARGGSLN